MPTIVLTSGSSWTVPADWDNAQNTIECIGAGGTGGVFTEVAAPGGAGGAYARITNLALTPGATVQFHIGQPGSAAATVDTWFNGASVAAASVGAKGAIGSARGLASASIGTLKRSGGAAGTSVFNHQGGGGGAGGPSGDGASGGSASTQYGAGGGAADGGAAGSPSGANNGGNGGASAHAAGGAGGLSSLNEPATHGGNGSQGSGGGGGGDYDGFGGDGGNGGAGIGMGDGSIGPGGGGGGVGSFSVDAGIAGAGGLYGGGGGAGGGLGAQGVIVISYGSPSPQLLSPSRVDDAETVHAPIIALLPHINSPDTFFAAGVVALVRMPFIADAEAWPEHRMVAFLAPPPVSEPDTFPDADAYAHGTVERFHMRNTMQSMTGGSSAPGGSTRAGRASGGTISGRRGLRFTSAVH